MSRFGAIGQTLGVVSAAPAHGRSVDARAPPPRATQVREKRGALPQVSVARMAGKVVCSNPARS